ncbi:hypothetical protein [Flavobacterium sp. UGB4466]|nr:hypothetical protein [Flavobacterium sp. UGB4466]
MTTMGDPAGKENTFGDAEMFSVVRVIGVEPISMVMDPLTIALLIICDLD